MAGDHSKHSKTRKSGAKHKMIKLSSLYIWLVENNNPFKDVPADEVSSLKKGIITELTKWFSKVLTNSNATSQQPKGYIANVKILWSDLSDTSKIKDLDLIIYFSPNNEKDSAFEVYKSAAKNLSDKEYRSEILKHKVNLLAHGETFSPYRKADNSRLPTLSDVYVYYQADISYKPTRIEINIDKLSKIAFHEAAHNKSQEGDEMHRQGGLLSDIYTNQSLTADNFNFVAKHIWDWSPQFIKGQPLKVLTKP